MSLCLDAPPSSVEYCDPVEAQELLSRDCDGRVLAMSAETGNPFTDAIRAIACDLGVLSACHVDSCEAPFIAAKSPEECLAALALTGCGQCRYYECLEQFAECGAAGYLSGYVGPYCQRFTQVTIPRLSDDGAAWVGRVRECLIERMADGFYEGERCDTLWQRGSDDHVGCYVDSGICDLGPGDLLAIRATVAEWDLPIGQLFSVGTICAGQWLGWQ